MKEKKLRKETKPRKTKQEDKKAADKKTRRRKKESDKQRKGLITTKEIQPKIG
ncbi:hypothetical protein [Escherichia coli]|uniref:hypothetical protein n=1 Tax=Escherichia coli TaxID=562 RepID=UPI0015938C96|nr:hypothetical protein [Escherichia coli]